MKKELCICLVFGLSQLILSIVIWGNLEYSIMAGDMVQSDGSSFWPFVFSNRFGPYAIVSIVNLVLLRVLMAKFRSKINPGFSVAVLLAGGTVALSIPLSLNTPFRVPPPFVATVAFIISWIFYLALSAITKNRQVG